MREKNISTHEFLKDYGFSKGTPDSLKQSRNVTIHTIDWLCQVLEVPVEKVVHISIDEFRDRQYTYMQAVKDNT